MSIRAKLLAVSFLGMLALVLALVGYFAQQMEAESLASSKTRIELILEKQANLAQQKLNRLLSLLQSMQEVGDKVHFGLMLSNLEESKAALLQYSSVSLDESNTPAFPNIYVLDLDGNVLTSSNSTEQMTMALTETISDEIKIIHNDVNSTFTFYLPLKAEGSVFAVLLAETNPGLFEEIRRSLHNELRRFGFLASQAQFRREQSVLTSVFRELNGFFVSDHSLIFPDGSYGVLQARIPVTEVTDPIYRSLLTSFQVAAFVLMFAFGLLSVMTFRFVIRPLTTLKAGADRMASGDLELSIHLNQNDEIGALAASFNHLASAVLASQRELQKFIEGLEDTVRAKTASIQNLLDNAGQGFLSFDRNFLVQAEFSRLCLSFFGQEFAAGARIDAALFDSEGEREGFRSWLINAFEDRIDFEVIRDLAPAQLTVSQRICSVEYRLLKSEDQRLVMLILTDITDKVRLEDRIREEQSFARMILRVLDAKEEFVTFLADFEDSVRDLGAWISKPDRSQLVELFRKIHTLKGHAAAFEFLHLTNALHHLESLMQDIRTDPTHSLENVEHLSESLVLVQTSMEELKVRLKESLKDAIDWEEKRILISEQLLKRIISRVKQSDELLHEELLACVHKPLQGLLSQYPALVDSLADRLGKLVHPVQITGDTIFVEPNRLKPFVRSLVHLFRNAVDHGIEDPELRDSIGKDPYGCIRIDLAGSKNGILIKLSDDGAGIDPERIGNLAIEKGLISEQVSKKYSTTELQMLIFLPGFSTRDVTSDLSGRGIGMDAVMAEVNALGGTIDLESTVGQGTTFTIFLPILPEKHD